MNVGLRTRIIIRRMLNKRCLLEVLFDVVHWNIVLILLLLFLHLAQPLVPPIQVSRGKILASVGFDLQLVRRKNINTVVQSFYVLLSHPISLFPKLGIVDTLFLSIHEVARIVADSLGPCGKLLFNANLRSYFANRASQRL